MNSTQLFIGLLALLVGLFLIALLQSYVFKKQHVMGVQDFKDELAKLLPSHDLPSSKALSLALLLAWRVFKKPLLSLINLRQNTSWVI